MSHSLPLSLPSVVKDLACYAGTASNGHTEAKAMQVFDEVAWGVVSFVSAMKGKKAGIAGAV